MLHYTNYNTCENKVKRFSKQFSKQFFALLPRVSSIFEQMTPFLHHALSTITSFLDQNFKLSKQPQRSSVSNLSDIGKFLGECWDPSNYISWEAVHLDSIRNWPCLPLLKISRPSLDYFFKFSSPTNILQITRKTHFPVVKKPSKKPEELRAFSIRILNQNLKYLILTPSILEKTDSKKRRNASAQLFRHHHIWFSILFVANTCIEVLSRLVTKWKHLKLFSLRDYAILG